MTSNLLFLIIEEIHLLRQQFFKSNGEKLQQIVRETQKVVQNYIEQFATEEEQVSEVLNRFSATVQGLLLAMEGEDYILCADLLETEFYPLAAELLSAFGEEEEPEWSEKYQMERACSGDWTIRTKGEKSFYLHSTVNPREEAKIWMDRVLEIGKSSYVIWGVGLGYHVEAVYNRISGHMPIRVYEQDKELIKLAGQYGRLPELKTGEVEVIHDPEGKLFAEAAEAKNSQVLLHFPSVKKIDKEQLQYSFRKFFISDSTGKEIKEELLLNFVSNTHICNRSADEILGQMEGKKAIIVAAGPSLDKNVELLKQKKEDTVVIAVGTVFEKLIKAGITPDFVTFMDAQERTFRQMENLLPLQLQVPIVVDSTACWRFIKEYTGPKYIAYQYGYEEAEKVAEQKRYTLFETGGTVTSLAMDLAIRGKASAVICIGMDLAYTGGVTHTAGTMDCAEADQNEELEVPGYYGGTVKTKLIFNMYREWIERRITRCQGITFVNATEGGVFVKGMIHQPLNEWI